MTFISRREADLYCDGCGTHFLLSPDELTAPEVRRMAREEGWTLTRPQRLYGQPVGARDLCIKCSEGRS